ncbi:MAG: 3-hydroxyacyl-[acyl-carrier-protein] dehydratase FabZ [Acidobacteria bacterium]|nr:MAG: 3-hydroxyacyl-[acyl-carrier-protein] dehydratase FabZ [Acidobacteriota bacterium]
MSDSEDRDVRWIQSILPHRYPMLMVDRVLALVPGRRIVAIKNVTAGEEVLQGHFPGWPVMPGVLIIEGLAQTAGILQVHAMSDAERSGKLVYLTSIERARFRRPVVPGDQLRFEVELLRARPRTAKMDGRAFVGDRRVAEALLSSTMVER